MNNKNSKIDNLIKWIKGISWQTWLTILISAFGTYFAFDSYNRTNSGEISPVINGKACKEDLIIAFLHTEGPIQVYNPQFNQCIKNTSKYSIKNLKVNCRLSFFPYDNLLKDFNFEVNPLFQRTSVSQSNGLYNIDFVYKQSDFYAGEYTPPFFKKIALNPNNLNDSTIHFIDIITSVNWDGVEETHYSSRINFALVPSTPYFRTWIDSCIYFMKNKLPEDDIDVVLCYKTFSDSLNEHGFPMSNKGQYSHFKNLNKTLIDSISFTNNTPSVAFLNQHLNYLQEDKAEPNISYTNILAIAFTFIIAIFIFVIIIKAYSNCNTTEKIFLVVMFIFPFALSIILIANELNRIYNLSTVSRIAKSISYILTSLASSLLLFRFIFFGVKNMKNIKQIYSKDKASIIAWFIVTVYFAYIEYYTITELIKLL